MTFDLDLWPTDLKINRDHLLTKDYLPTKFEASGAKRYWVISCTRLRATDIPTYIPTYRPTGAKQYAPPFSKGGINIIVCLLNTLVHNKCITGTCVSQIITKNKTNHLISSNSHPSVTTNKESTQPRNSGGGGGLQNQREHNIINN